MSDFNFDFSLGALARPIIGALTGYTQGGGAYSPASLFSAGEQGVWYDPSDFSTMWQDATRTAPVTAVGQPVGAINDKSGRGNHATQATSAARPVLQVDGAGKYYLAFDGVDDFLSTGPLATLIPQPTLHAAGLVFNAVVDNQHITDGDATNRQFLIGGGTELALSAGTILIGGTISAATKYVASGYFDGVASKIRQNGVLAVSGNSGTGQMGSIYIGANYLGGTVLNGNIYQIIIRGAASSADQITATETYVNSKTGAY